MELPMVGVKGVEKRLRRHTKRRTFNDLNDSLHGERTDNAICSNPQQ